MKYLLIGLVVVVVLALGFLWNSYNTLVGASEGVDNQWAQVEAQYQRRFDLIPNLVESVKGIFEQEKEVFGKLADARAKYSGAATVNEKAQAAGGLESALARLLVIVENYPQLRSSESVQTLMVQLEGTENRVSVERMRFNDATRSYNVLTKRFPMKMIAGMFGFGERDYFNAAAGAESAPKVEF